MISRIFLGVQQQAGIHELVGPESAILIVEDRLQTKVPVVWSISLSMVSSVPVASSVPSSRLMRLDHEQSPRPHAANHGRQAILGERKNHGDRLHLRDHQQPVGVRRVHDVARIHQTQTDAAIDRRGDLRVHHIELGAIDLGLIGRRRRLRSWPASAFGCRTAAAG